MTQRCPTCGDTFQKLANHFAWKPDHRPPLNPLQRDIVSFLALTRVGFNDRDTERPKLHLYSEDKEFLHVLSEALGWLANDPFLHESGEELAERSGFDYGEVQWSDYWGMSTLPHPAFEDFTSRLTPRVARWLIMDSGSWHGGPIGTLWIDCRHLQVDSQDLKRTLHRSFGVSKFVHDSAVSDRLDQRGHWDEDVIAIPHWEAMDLLEEIGLSLTEVEWVHGGNIEYVDGDARPTFA